MKENREHIIVKDYSVSEELFELKYNPEWDMLETTPQPLGIELSKYYQSDDYISHTDARRNLFEKVYHLVRNVALKRKLKLINSLQSEGGNLLDVGCGTGDFLKIAKENNWIVTGIEPDERARVIANRKTENSVFDIEKLAHFKKQNFEVITLWHVLEHLPNLESQVSVLKSLLKPNGRLIVAVPNYKSYDAKFYREFWAAYDAPRHLWHFSQTAVTKIFAKENMVVEKTLPMKFDAYYVSLLSEKNKAGWMNIFRAFVIGFTSNIKARSSSEYSSLIYVIKNH